MKQVFCTRESMLCFGLHNSQVVAIYDGLHSHVDFNNEFTKVSF